VRCGAGKFIVETGCDVCHAQRPVEHTITAVWEEVLSIKNPGVNDNFLTWAARSLQVEQVQTQLRERVGHGLPVLMLFEYPTIRSLAGFLRADKKEEPFAQRIHERTHRRRSRRPVPAFWRPSEVMNPTDTVNECVAVIGMAGRFPGAKTWTSSGGTCATGVESVSFFQDEEVRGRCSRASHPTTARI